MATAGFPPKKKRGFEDVTPMQQQQQAGEEEGDGEELADEDENTTNNDEQVADTTAVVISVSPQQHLEFVMEMRKAFENEMKFIEVLDSGAYVPGAKLLDVPIHSFRELALVAQCIPRTDMLHVYVLGDTPGANVTDPELFKRVALMTPRPNTIPLHLFVQQLKYSPQLAQQ